MKFPKKFEACFYLILASKSVLVVFLTSKLSYESVCLVKPLIRGLIVMHGSVLVRKNYC